MTLEETWKNCLSMWRWIAKEVRKGNKKYPSDLKTEWLAKHGIEKDEIYNDCFFCEHAATHATRNAAAITCPTCPGSRADKTFDCQHEDYCFSKNPIAFYNKLRALNRKRLKAKQV
jgi:hypothetical protein